MIYDFTIYPIEFVLKIVFTVLHSATNSYLLAIVLLSVIVRLVTKPLEKIADRSVRQEREISAILSPQIEIIKKITHGAATHDAIKRLYSRYGYHPIFSIRSLANLFVQLPFFLAAFYMLSNFSSLQGAECLFLGDLGKPDALLPGALNLMPFVMFMVNLLALFTAPRFSRKDIVQGMVVAILFLCLLYNSPLALLIYWTMNNVFSLISNIYFILKEKFNLPSLSLTLFYNRLRSYFLEYGYIFFLYNIAVLIPILGVLGDQFVFFSAHGLSGKSILLFIVLFSTIPPLVISVFRVFAKVLSFTKVYDSIVTFLFLGLFLTYTINKTGYDFISGTYWPYVLLFVSIILTCLGSTFIIRKKIFKELSYLSVIIPLVIGHFVFISPASALFVHVVGGTAQDKSSKIYNTPVFLLIFDEFSGLTLQNSKRELDKTRYPGFAELSKYADYFPNALTSSRKTSIAIPNILSGNIRSEKFTSVTPRDNLIDYFKSVSSVNSYSSVIPAELNTFDSKRVNLSAFFSDFITLYLHILFYEDWAIKMFGQIPPTWSDFGIFHGQKKLTEETDVLSLFENWVEASCQGKYQFNFLHILFPHTPYLVSSTGKKLVNADSANHLAKIVSISEDSKEEFRANQSTINAFYHGYMQQSAYVDKMVGEFVDKLRENSLFEKSLIIISADHGVSYNRQGQNRRRPMNQDSWKNIISIPFFIKYPYQNTRKINNSYITSLDIARTIMASIGVNIPWESIGQNLLDLPEDVQTNSVSAVPGYGEYIKQADGLFTNTILRKKRLFGETQPLHTIAVNYTEDQIYDSLLNVDISSLKLVDSSPLLASIEGMLKPQAGIYMGTLHLNDLPQNDQIVVVAVGGKIYAIFKSGITKKKDGFFSFSLPDHKEFIPTASVDFYQVEGTENFTLRKISVTNRQEYISKEFETAESIAYDWQNSIQGIRHLTTQSTKDGMLARPGGEDPFIVFNRITNDIIPNPIFYIELESDTDFSLQFFYATTGDSNFIGDNSLGYRLKKGESKIYVKIPAEDFNGKFRIDIDSKSGTEVLFKEIEIRFQQPKNFTLRKISATTHQEDISKEFWAAKSVTYDWQNSINGIRHVTTQITKDGMVARSSGEDPFIVFNRITGGIIPNPIFYLELESKNDFSLQFFYATTKDSNFIEPNSMMHRVKEGENKFYVKIPAEDFNGKFRIDIGSKPGTEVLFKEIGIRSQQLKNFIKE